MYDIGLLSSAICVFTDDPFAMDRRERYILTMKAARGYLPSQPIPIEFTLRPRCNNDDDGWKNSERVTITTAASADN